MKIERGEGGYLRFKVTDIPTDMDEGTKMDILVNGGGDVYITVRDADTSLEITINSGQGGTHTNGLAARLIDAVDYLVRSEEDPDYAIKFSVRRLGRPEIE